MRKWVVGILFIFLLLIAAVYLLVPVKPVVTQTVWVAASAKSCYRNLTQQSMVEKWWRDSNSKQPFDTAITADGWRYHFTPLMYNGARVQLRKGADSLESVIAINALQQDTTILEWKAEWPAAGNPVQRLQQYWQARAVKNNMQEVLQRFAAFINDPQKVYGLHIERTKVKDTLLLTNKRVLKSFPTTSAYYSMIGELQQYIAASGAQATNYPMLNISALNDKEYGVMVALPVSKEVPPKGAMQIKRMISGNILVTEVTGGIHTVENALQQLQYYTQENGLLPPAIPYQLLVTNRLAEPDTSRWVTKVYFPVY